jgi:hypothetical protein
MIDMFETYHPPSLDCDTLLHSSRCILFAVLEDSPLLLVALFTVIVLSCVDARHTGTPLKLPFLTPQVLLCHG